MQTKLYLHYKNKPYKYLNEAKHSETREEMVVYETLYESPGGRFWVRPKTMFHETIEVNGVKMPRFRQVELEIKATTEVNTAEIETIAHLMKKAFGEWDPNWFFSTFNNHKKFHLLTAHLENETVGFKLGYERDQWEFYSWLGGVAPEARGLGVASLLMKAQHEWCTKQGYVRVQTKTQNRFRSMLLLNIKNGFDIIGTHSSDQGGMKIVLEKKLTLK